MTEEKDDKIVENYFLMYGLEEKILQVCWTARGISASVLSKTDITRILLEDVAVAFWTRKSGKKVRRTLENLPDRHRRRRPRMS